VNSEDRIAGLLEALEIVKNVQAGYELKVIGTVHYKLQQQAADRAKAADECRLLILSRIDTIRHDND
jgi:3-deoxy-D-manno-octulosonic acid (KDO) 8-phosphate synthase